LTLVTMRASTPSSIRGRARWPAYPAALELMGIRVYRPTTREVGEVIRAAADSAFLAGEQVAVLLGQRLIGRKNWKGTDERTLGGTALDRRAFVAALVAGVPEALIVSGLGSPSYDLFAGATGAQLLPVGRDGAAVPIASVSRSPNRTVGRRADRRRDSSWAWQPGGCRCRRPSNLSIVVLDNGHYGETACSRATPAWARTWSRSRVVSGSPTRFGSHGAGGRRTPRPHPGRSGPTFARF